MNLLEETVGVLPDDWNEKAISAETDGFCTGNCGSLDVVSDYILYVQGVNDELIEALQKARTGYLNLIELELLPHQGYYDECQEHINEMDKVLAIARGES